MIILNHFCGKEDMGIPKTFNCVQISLKILLFFTVTITIDYQYLYNI